MNNSSFYVYMKFASNAARLGLLFILIISRPVSGQVAEEERSLSAIEKAPSSIVLSGEVARKDVLLEEKVDPETYILGPGDIISIFTWGNFQGQYSLPVSPEGVLLVPEIGPISVANLTIKTAGQRITSRILERYRNVETVISLVGLRKFKVYVGGAVNAPGAYAATAVTRVSEIISNAGGFLHYLSGNEREHIWDSGRIPEGQVMSSKRNLKILRKDGSTIPADILRFEVTGRTEYDPTLMDGDRIFVPVRENTINLYGVFGAVRNPGYFEYSPHDSLSDLFDIAHGLTASADSSSVSIVRFGKDNRQTFEIAIDLTSADWNVPLFPDDRVYIKAHNDYREKYQVELQGEFRYPGFYPISKDSTKLSEIVKSAGAFTESASLEEGEVVRVSAEELVDPEFERLKKMNVPDMLDSEYDYFKTKSRSKPGRVAVDFVGLFTEDDSSRDFILRDGDVITVPRKSRVINVIGEVSNPGIQPFRSDVDYRFYLDRAGGFSDRADKGKVTIVKGVTSEWKEARKGKGLEAGDTIWVPERKKRNYWGITRDTLVFIGNLATVYLVIEQATK